MDARGLTALIVTFHEAALYAATIAFASTFVLTALVLRVLGHATNRRQGLAALAIATLCAATTYVGLCKLSLVTPIGVEWIRLSE